MIIVMICKYFPQCFIETACRAQYHRVGLIYMQELSTIKYLITLIAIKSKDQNETSCTQIHTYLGDCHTGHLYSDLDSI